MERTVRIIGAPMDYGANRRGVDMGPSAIRYADLADGLERAGVDPVDDGDLTMPRAEERDPDADQPVRGTRSSSGRSRTSVNGYATGSRRRSRTASSRSCWAGIIRSRSGR